MKRILIALILLSCTFAFDQSSLTLDHVETDWGSGCQYYNIDNKDAYDVLTDSPKAHLLEVTEANVRNGRWEYPVTTTTEITQRTHSDYNCDQEEVKKAKKDELIELCMTWNETTELCDEKWFCIDNSDYITFEETTTTWLPMDDKYTFKSKEVTQVRYCAEFDMGIHPDGGWGAKIDVIPEFPTGIMHPEYAWWDTSWQKCVPITITVGGGFPANYTHNITLNTSNVNYSNMQADIEDIRFLEGDCSNPTGSALGQWNRTVNTAGDSRIYVMTTTANATGIALYYNNSGASNIFDINKAFLVGDDFDDASFNTTKWNETSNSGTLTESGGYINLSGGASNAEEQIKSVVQQAPPVICIAETYFEIAAASGDMEHEKLGVSNTAYTDYLTAESKPYVATGIWRAKDGGTADADTRGNEFSTWTNTTIWVYNSTTAYEYINGSLDNTQTNAQVPDGSNLGLVISAKDAGRMTYVTWMGLQTAPLNTTWPSYSFGAEESAPTTIYWTSPTPANNTNNFTYGMVYNFTISSGTISTGGNKIEVDGTNYSCVLSGDSLGCAVTLNYTHHIFNNTYSIKAFGNVSGTITTGNETTREIPYYGCGNTGSGTMLGNVSTTGTCFTFNATSTTFDCAGYRLTGDNSGTTDYGIDINDKNTFSVQNCDIFNFYEGIRVDDDTIQAGNIGNSTFQNQTQAGVRIVKADNIIVQNNTFQHQPNHGVELNANATYCNLTNNTITNITWNGFRVDSSGFNRFEQNTMDGTGHGFWFSDYGTGGAGGAINNTIFNNTIDISNETGIAITAGGTDLTGNNITNNTIGAYTAGIYLTDNANNTVIDDNIIYKGNESIYILNANGTTGDNNRLYNASYVSLLLNSSSAVDYTISLTGTLFDNPAGGLINYTNLTISDTFNNEAYSINWTTNSTSLSSPSTVSFEQKFINISIEAGSPSIDTLTWYWTDAETSGYTESYIGLWKYNGSWSSVDNTPDTANNQIAISALSSFSDFALLEKGGYPYWASPTPPNNTNNFTYGMVYNFTISSGTISTGGNKIEVDGTNYSCVLSGDSLGCAVTLNYTHHIFNNTYDLKAFGNISGTITTGNETTREIPYYGCGNTGSGTMLDDVSSTTTSCFTFNSSDVDFNCAGKTLDGNDIANTYGFHIDIKKNTSIEDCTITDYDMGIYFESLVNESNVTNTTISSCSVGIELTGDTFNITIANNTISSASNGIITFGAGNSTFQNNTVYSSTTGIAFSDGTNNTVTGNTVYSNTNGIHLYGDSYDNDLSDNNAYLNTYGIYFNSAPNCTSTNDTAYSNSNYGIYLTTNSDYLTITNATAYNNTNDGLYITGSDNNTITNITSYNNTDYGIRIASSSNNSITTGSIYRNSKGGFFVSSANMTNSTDLHLYNNTWDYNATAGASAMVTYHTNLTIDDSTGTMQNYTSITIDDAVTASTAYAINWTTNSTATRGGYFSFANKYVRMNITTGTPSIDALTWHWADSELGATYNETNFHLYKYNNSWHSINSTPDTTNNQLKLFSLTSFSIFGILEQNTTVYFTNPTPANLTNHTNLTITINLSTDVVATDPCYITVDGTNQTGTIDTATNKSCTYNITPSSHGHVYSLTGWMNISSIMVQANETNRTFRWYNATRCINLTDVFNLTMNTSAYAKVGDTKLYVKANLTLNNTCAASITNLEYDINDSTAEGNWSVRQLNFTSLQLRNVSAYQFRIPLNFTDEGEVGGYSFFARPYNHHYHINTTYNRNVTQMRVNISAVGDEHMLYKCEEEDCDLVEADWNSTTLTYTLTSGRIYRTGDELDDLDYIVSWSYAGDTQDGGGGGDAILEPPPANDTEEEEEEEEEAPEDDQNDYPDPNEDTEFYLSQEGMASGDSRIATAIARASGGNIKMLPYTCDSFWAESLGEWAGILDFLFCEWKGILSLYLKQFGGFINMALIALLTFIYMGVKSKNRDTRAFQALMVVGIITLVLGLNFIFFSLMMLILILSGETATATATTETIPQTTDSTHAPTLSLADVEETPTDDGSWKYMLIGFCFVLVAMRMFKK